MNIQELIMKLSKDPRYIDVLLRELNKIAKDTYGSEGGLPISDDNASGNMSFLVLRWLSRLEDVTLGPDASAASGRE